MPRIVERVAQLQAAFSSHRRPEQLSVAASGEDYCKLLEQLNSPKARPARGTMAKAAVLIDGKSAGGIFYLCQTEKCDVHNRVTRYQPTPHEQAQRRKEALAERVEKLSRVRILEAIRKKLPEALSRPDLEMVALDYFPRLGHDNHHRLSKLYAWEEKNSKTLKQGGELLAKTTATSIADDRYRTPSMSSHTVNEDDRRRRRK